MCGICGIFSLNSEQVNKNELQRMNDRLIHRGPDEEGIYVDRHIGLASRRLSIIDLETGNQPIHSEDKNLWVIFNGEIYNFLKLKKELIKKGHRFYTHSDTECLVHLYEELGERCVDKLDGMYSFAIWDKNRKTLAVFRDPIGKKPLYWTIFENKFIFASEPKAILSLNGFKAEINRESLAKYFFYGYVPAPLTIFQKINRLPSGSWLKIDKYGLVKEKKFWEFDYSSKVNLSEEEIKKEIVRLLKSAVEKRLLADVPIGVFLSGGIDSSLIAALIPSKKIEAFTIGFEEKSADESVFAKKVASYLGLEQNLKIFSSAEVFSIFPEILSFMDEPMADPSILPTYFLSQFTKQKVKVALSGDGGDENFAGYPKYLGHLFLNKTGLEKADLSLFSSFFPKKMNSFLRYSHLPLYKRNQFWLSSSGISETMALTDFKLNFEELERSHRDFNGKDPLDEAFFLDQKMTLTDQFLVKVDRASMASSLEVRCPFLDLKLVEFSAKIPSSLKIKRLKTKSLLREIAADYLPQEIIDRPKKGFGIPLDDWLSGALKPYVKEYVSVSRIKKENILNIVMAKKLIDKGNPHFIWKLLLFEFWKEKWLKN